MLSLDKSRIPASKEDAARKIDYTVLRPTDTIEQMLMHARNADKLGFRSIVVPPFIVASVKEIVKIPVSTVISFPLGYNSLDVKIEEVRQAHGLGADEVDVVLNISAMKSRSWDYVEKEVKAIAELARSLGLTSKFIIETSYLSREEIEKASRIIAGSGGDYIKTNTGFGSRGVSLEDVIIIRKAVGSGVGIKAAGGIRTALQAILLWGIGADILGTSSALEIYNEYEETLKYIRGSLIE